MFLQVAIFLLFFPRLQIRVRRVGGAQSHQLRDRPHGQDGFLPQACRHRQFFRVALSSCFELPLRPVAAFQFCRENFAPPCFGAFLPQLAILMVRPCLCAGACPHCFPKSRAAQAPTPPQRGKLLRLLRRLKAQLHPLFKLPASRFDQCASKGSLLWVTPLTSDTALSHGHRRLADGCNPDFRISLFNKRSSGCGWWLLRLIRRLLWRKACQDNGSQIDRHA